MTAEAEFRDHAARLEAFRSLQLSEADTRVHLIDPVLRLLGYSAVGDIRREVPVPATKEFLDYELRVAAQPVAIVEAKALRHSISDQHAAQCVQYAAILGVRWCLITNGVTWAVYNAHARGPLADKQVAVVHLDGDEQAVTEAWAVLALFARDALAQAEPLTRLLTRRVVQDELSRPDSPAIAALRRAVKERFGDQVSAQAVLDAVRHLPGQPPRGAPGADVPRSTPRLRPVASRLTTTTESGRVQLMHLIEAGLLPPDATLDCTLYGVTHTARLRDDGRIELQGVLYLTPSAAACALRDGKATNGWVVWRHKGVLLADLRARFAEQAGSPGSAGSECERA